MLAAIVILIIIMIILGSISMLKAIGAFITFVGICFLTSFFIIGIMLILIGAIFIFFG